MSPLPIGLPSSTQFILGDCLYEQLAWWSTLDSQLKQSRIGKERRQNLGQPLRKTICRKRTAPVVIMANIPTIIITEEQLQKLFGIKSVVFSNPYKETD
ncbi:hypothetical protein [Vibrio owensii]|uniref:hypothetical protein n=1 Tax=Vibrio owensii TaxID=696485 RepID=UPI0018F1B9F3|nr:hypothetical protein [Vibrio owensii]